MSDSGRLLTLDQACSAGESPGDRSGGGFARYSADRWLVPHFEKMLSR